MNRVGVYDALVPLAVRRLGTIAYKDALALQEEHVRDRRAERITDTLLLLQHPHVITLGSSSDPAHVLASPDERASLGIEVVDAGRGGDVTYHGPGQLIGYPILALEDERRDLHRYLRDLEAALIEGLGVLGVQGVKRRASRASGPRAARSPRSACGSRRGGSRPMDSP